MSPGTSEILVALNSNSVKLLNKKGNLMNEYKEYKGKVHAAFFSAKGIKIITSENRRYHQQVRIWDGDGKLLQNFSWPSRNFLSLTVSPDGTKLFGKNSYSGNAIIQDTSGKLLHEYRGEGGDFSCFAFSPDGSKIITGSQSGKLKWWETMLTMEEFLASGKIDELTAEQKREFGIR